MSAGVTTELRAGPVPSRASLGGSSLVMGASLLTPEGASAPVGATFGDDGVHLLEQRDVSAFIHVDEEFPRWGGPSASLPEREERASG